MSKSTALLVLLAAWSILTMSGAAETEPAAGPSGAAKARPDLRPTPAQLKVAKIRELKGRHLTLYTDLPAGPGVDSLPDAFDQAFDQWLAYFHIEITKSSAPIVACLMREKPRFAAVGLLPADLPAFDHAYFRGNRIWVFDQKDDYYRRHLLLHEGTHAFMNTNLGACGPPWFMEGIAELLATHALVDGQVALNQFPADAEDVPGWGRVRLVRDALAAGRRMPIDDILTYDARAHEEVEPYGWCWAIAAFLDGHPRYQERFRELARHPDPKDFNDRFRKAFDADWRELAEEWQLFVAHLEYGYDLVREAINFRPGKPLPAAGAKVKVAADRGWQAAGVTLEAGKTYHLRATGRFQVAADPRPWPSGPEGVTIRYWERKPLGILLAAVHPEPFDPDSASTLLSPLAIGAEGTIRPEATGTLYLRINDSPAELDDNKGSLDVQIRPE
ncbi:MAG TPA: hypothetical protein VHD36_10975 [Pirellulales bacterium]|nr:hypothetical protein [Pirellulales bacterium]